MARILISFLMVVLLGSAASAHGRYSVQPGDVLRVEVLEDQSLNRDALVLPDGTISVPLVGSVPAAGRTLDQIKGAIANALAPNFASTPTVFVNVANLNPTTTTTYGKIDVFIIGAVNTPGKVSIDPGTNLLQFLAQSGGFTRFAATKRIQLRRLDRKTGQTAVYKFNYKAIEDGSASANSIVLRNGDVIVVPERRLFE